MNLQVLYLDNHLLTLFKPAGLLAQADETGDPDILTEAKALLKHRFGKPGQVFLGLVHRLDRPASGIMVFARTSKAAARVADQFRRHQPIKKYLAIASGKLTGEGIWHDHLAKLDRQTHVVAPEHAKAKSAELAWRALANQEGTTLVEVSLKTGRPHQIRVQFASRGFPLLGDLRYGARAEFDGVNLALHAFMLQIEHPVKREPIAWSARPPQSWRGWYEGELAGLFAGLGEGV